MLLFKLKRYTCPSIMGYAFQYVSPHFSPANQLLRTLHNGRPHSTMATNQILRLHFVALDTCYHAPATDFNLNPYSLSSARSYFRFHLHKESQSNEEIKVFTIGMDGRTRRVDSRRIADGKDNLIIEQIMLRYRPIAPRPATDQSSGHVLPEKDVKRTRVKRKYVRVKKTKKNKSKVNDSKNWFDLDGSTVAMIEDSKGSEVVVTDPLQNVSNWISFGLPGNERRSVCDNLFTSEPSDLHGVDLAPAVRRRKIVESWITVESVTGSCEDKKLLGFTDEEIWKNLESDSCPGFISHSFDEVLWVNPAYRRMLDLNSDGEAQVWIVVKVEESTVVKYLPAFSCRVRIEYRSSEKKTRMMVPGDVFQMDSGGFAWRLDVKFALSLGPLS